MSLTPVLYPMSIECSMLGSQASIYVKQGDVKTRECVFYLKNESSPYVIPVESSVVLRALKPDGTYYFGDCVISGSIIRYQIAAELMAVVGEVRCELNIYGNDMEVLFSPEFKINVIAALFGDNEITSSDEFSALTNAMTTVNNVTEKWLNPSASASSGAAPDASVVVGDNGVAFNFTLERGLQGVPGPQGDIGPQGEIGKGLDIKGTFESIELLESVVLNPQQGDMYNVGTEAPYTIYMWDESDEPSDWVSQGHLEGPQGIPGGKGDKGDKGDAGHGLATGGTSGQVPSKASNADYDMTWKDVADRNHASRHATGGGDAITPSNIGAAPSTHASQHATGGNDAITPGDIGAAAATHASQHATGGSDAITPGNIGAAAATHASQHATGGADAITPGDIGAATATHASRHATGGADAITPSNIGAAGLDADNKVLADQASAKIVVVNASETIGLSRSGKHLLANSNTNITITIPGEATVAFPIGTSITFTDWIWGGRMTITPAAGVAIYWTNGAMNTKTSPNVGATCVGILVQAGVWLFGGF